MAVVHYVVLPGLEKLIEHALPLLLFYSDADSQLAESMRHECLTSEVLVQESHSAVVLQLLGEASPDHHGPLHAPEVSIFDNAPHNTKRVPLKNSLLLPFVKRSFHFFPRVGYKSIPYFLYGILFEMVNFLLLVDVVTPCVEDLVRQLLAVGQHRQVFVLENSGPRL